MKRKRKDNKTCHFADCKKMVKYGFLSWNNKIQPEKYCREHSEKVKTSFPKCKLIRLNNYTQFEKSEGDVLDFISEDKIKEVVKKILK